MRRFSGKELRRQREGKGMSRERLAVDANKGYDAIVAYESGRVDPPSSAVASMAATLGLDPGAFFVEVADVV